MKQADVKIGSVYETKIGEGLAWVEIVSMTQDSYSGRTKFVVRRVFDDGTKGPLLSKHRSSAALRPRPEEECDTCLGSGRLRDDDTAGDGGLRKCLDCRGAGKVLPS